MSTDLNKLLVMATPNDKADEIIKNVSWFDPIDQECVMVSLRNLTAFRMSQDTRQELQRMAAKFKHQHDQYTALLQKYHTKHIPGGRYYTTQGSMQLCPKKLRPYLSKQRLIELDGNNMGIQILAFVANVLDVPNAVVDAYLEDRDPFIATDLPHNCSKEQAKKLPLIIINGGSIKTWELENGITGAISFNLRRLCKVLEKMSQQVADRMFPHLKNHDNPDVALYINEMDENTNKKGKIISFILQNIETKIMGELVKYLQRSKIIKGRIMSLIHDAIIFPSNGNYNEEDAGTLLKIFVQHLAQKYQMPLLENLKFSFCELEKESSNEIAFSDIS